MTVVVIGDVVTDILTVHEGPLAIGSDTIASVRISGGGSAANTAAWLAHAGQAVTFAGVAGQDEPGDARLAELHAAGVATSVRRVPDRPTGTVVVLTSDAERTMFTDRGANRLLSPEDVDRALATPGARHLHLSAYVLFDADCAPAGRHALAEARRRGLTTSLDAASAAPLQRAGSAVLPWVDLLLANLDEAVVIAGRPGDPAQLAPALLAHAGEAVVKSGPGGATWVGPGSEPVHVAGVSVPEVVDPTGAGDAFAAGYLAARLSGADAAAALRAGNELGALAVSKLGGRP
ncbi:sugar kinase [Dactylosporangium sp. AC04546]|uniref:carbohydrate kinase family protein n=1 Tax=Dactylosporangium sp. AC04546 TaxID=2862460 RepID=UPI001EE111AA|nr:sugar kinase [Dactylosporangium sp. AC04546]WVK85404.1 sugar kinase [Dactylosporangium sp. AC04546]